MARLFNGTSDFLASASALNLSADQRIAIAFWTDTTFAADDNILLELSVNSNTNDGTFKVIADESGSNTFWVDMAGNVGKNIRNCPPPPSSTWHQVVINLNFGNPAATEIESIYIDAVPQTLSGTSTVDNTGTFGNYVLYVMSRAGAALFADGALADLAIWAPSSALSQADVTALQTARAGTVRPGELAYYWPLLGTTSPEPATVGAIALNVTGATQTADPPALAGGGTTVGIALAGLEWAGFAPTLDIGVILPGDGPPTVEWAGLAATVHAYPSGRDLTISAGPAVTPYAAGPSVGAVIEWDGGG